MFNDTTTFTVQSEGREIFKLRLKTEDSGSTYIATELHLNSKNIHRSESHHTPSNMSDLYQHILLLLSKNHEAYHLLFPNDTSIGIKYMEHIMAGICSDLEVMYDKVEEDYLRNRDPRHMAKYEILMVAITRFFREILDLFPEVYEGISLHDSYDGHAKTEPQSLTTV